jgi:hypothetical protein
VRHVIDGRGVGVDAKCVQCIFVQIVEHEETLAYAVPCTQTQQQMVQILLGLMNHQI